MTNNSQNVRRGLGLLAVAGVAVLALHAAPALGQTISPPRPQSPGDAPVLSNIGIAILVVGAIVGATVIPSKRGHQD
ncbi:MAG: hypothetical protein AAFX79_07430 [Planctomycetota bacterium]